MSLTSASDSTELAEVSVEPSNRRRPPPTTAPSTLALSLQRKAGGRLAERPLRAISIAGRRMNSGRRGVPPRRRPSPTTIPSTLALSLQRRAGRRLAERPLGAISIAGRRMNSGRRGVPPRGRPSPTGLSKGWRTPGGTPFTRDFNRRPPPRRFGRRPHRRPRPRPGHPQTPRQFGCQPGWLSAIAALPRPRAPHPAPVPYSAFASARW